MRILIIASFFGIAALLACQQGKSKLDNLGSNHAPTGSAGSDGAIDIDSKDILARPAGTGDVTVKHVLIAWKELDASTYHGRIDKRAAERTNAQAAELAQSIADKLRQNPDSIDGIVKASSEDPGSLSGEPYTINKDTPFVPEFKNLALRLNLKEVGIVKTQFGYHVIERVPPPPPDPLESADILARPGEKGPVMVEPILVGWKEVTKHGAGANRTKAEADKIATDILARSKTEDYHKLMKEFSEDPGSKDEPKPIEVSESTPILEPLKKLALRLKEGEVGIVKLPVGWLALKRVPPPPPPPPDPLESADILKREPPAAKVKVKHVLLGWNEIKGGDPRAAKRTRAELEKLVKDTVAKLNGGAKIEDVMKAVSEDPGSAKTGEGYDVTPDAGLVPPFKNLSLRLKLNEVGVVRTTFGIHIIKRVE